MSKDVSYRWLLAAFALLAGLWTAWQRTLNELRVLEQLAQEAEQRRRVLSRNGRQLDRVGPKARRHRHEKRVGDRGRGAEQELAGRQLARRRRGLQQGSQLTPHPIAHHRGSERATQGERHTRRAFGPSRSIRLSMPRCPLSRITLMAPMKVIQMKQ